MEKKSKNIVYIQTSERITLDDLAAKITEIVDHDDAAYFIARLDQMYESMEVTESLINHFEAVRQHIVKNEPDDVIDFDPKLLTDRA